ncbi:MAG: glycosyltransferase family 4 protein [Candidatus Anstonellales archaeon]
MIEVFDVSNSGHRRYFNVELVKTLCEVADVVYRTFNIPKDIADRIKYSGGIIEDLGRLSVNKVQKFIELSRCINNINKLGGDIVVYPFVDDLLLYNIDYKHKKVIGFLHNIPSSIIKRIKLKEMGRLKIVVLDDTIKEKLVSLGLSDKQINVVEYPLECLLDLSKRESIKNEVYTFLYFGGTWKYKGLDILLESLRYVKSRCRVIVAGRETEITNKFILRKLKHIPNNIEVDLRLRFISDEEKLALYNTSDCVILPYRSSFTGMSIVLLESLLMNKPVICSSLDVFKKYINIYSCGKIFKAESVMDLAFTIDNMVMYGIDVEWGTIDKELRDRSIRRFRSEIKEIVNGG